MMQMQRAVQPFCHLTKISVAYLDGNGNQQWENGEGERVCTFFHGDQEHQKSCKRTLLSATRMAAQLAEPYIFLCPSGLVKIAVSVIVEGKIEGTLVAGPIAMGHQKENVMKSLLRNILLPRDVYPQFLLCLNRLTVFFPKEVADLASLVNSVVLSSLIANEDYRKVNDRFKSEAYLAEGMKRYKKKNKKANYPHHLEAELLQQVKAGDDQKAQDTLVRFLEEIFLLESGNLSFIKIQVISLCAILSRITATQESSVEISSLEMENMDMLNKAESFQEVEGLAGEIVRQHARTRSSPLPVSGSFLIDQSVQYIHAHYLGKLSLTGAAEALHTNSSYLSALFKKTTGLGFIDYVNQIRIKESKELLSATNLSLVEIALNTGFESQSYFTKIFKRETGITPREYRKANQTRLYQ